MHCLSGYFTKPLFVLNSITNIILYPHLKTLYKENSIMAIVPKLGVSWSRGTQSWLLQSYSQVQLVG